MDMEQQLNKEFAEPQEEEQEETDDSIQEEGRIEGRLSGICWDQHGTCEEDKCNCDK